MDHDAAIAAAEASLAASEDAATHEELAAQTSGGPQLLPTLDRLADLAPATLAVMHGSSYHGDGATQLRALAAGYSAAAAELAA